MVKDIEYRVLDSGCILRSCLHNGPIPIAETHPENSSRVAAESEAAVTAGTIDTFLKGLCKAYGAYGFAALDGDMIIGQVRFFPSIIEDIYPHTATGAAVNTCVQEHHQIQAMEAIDISSLPPKDDISPKSLTLMCFQLVNDYKAMAEGRATEQPSYLHRGIGIALLEKAIAWARAEGWDEIRATAIPHIPPLMCWACQLSVKRFQQYGFEVIPSAEKCDGGVSQRQGYHGEAMKRMWEPYAHLSDEEVSRMYDVVLRLS